jgi:hypothetical protein
LRKAVTAMTDGGCYKRPSQQAMDAQTSYDQASKTYTAKCAVCGKAHRKVKKWYRSRDATKAKLRLHFNFCGECGRWVCEDCYLVHDGVGNGIGVCRKCGEKQGIKGLTMDEALRANPEMMEKFKKITPHP